MRKKKVLITGAFGFLGRNAARYFKDNGYKVFGIGYGKWKSGEEKKWGIDNWKTGEVNLKNLSKYSVKFDLIIHCAGGSSVGYSMAEPLRDFQLTVDSSVVILEFMRLKCPKSRLIYPSSAAVYGEKPDKMIRENDLLSPVSPYGFNKKIVEEMCELYSKNFGLNISIIRFFSLYGVGLKKQLLWDACEKVRKEKSKVYFFGTGKETRDWLNVKDAASFFFAVSKSNRKFEIINGASGKRVETGEVLEILKRNYGKDVKINFIKREKPGDPKYYHADISRAKGLGWLPKIDLESGISEYVNFYKEL
jgi:UDP-glucose 4-epimerase